LKFEVQFVGVASAETAYGRTFWERIGAAEKAGYARFLGSKSREELIALYDGASGVVHFPGEEAFGLVVAEALARGVKMFGARVGGIVDIAGEVPGVELFDVEDWRGLGAALAGWMRAGCPPAGGGADLMRARYHPEVIARRHLEIYREVLHRKSETK
jgi:glycosyltransferase involved in cell wall biosynthesis